MDMNKLMQQAQQMQKNLDKQKEELKSKKYEETAGGGAVKVVMNGGFEVESIDIDEDLLISDNKEMLEELVMIAINNILTSAKKDEEDSMNNLAGGVDLSSLF